MVKKTCFFVSQNVPIKFARRNRQFEGLLGELFRQLNLVGTAMERADKYAAKTLIMTTSRNPLQTKIKLNHNWTLKITWARMSHEYFTGFLIWWLIIWVYASNWLAFLRNLSSSLLLAKPEPKSWALIGQHKLI